MTDESQPPRELEGSSPTPLQKLDKAARLRAEAAQLIIAAEKLETEKTRALNDASRRDSRILGEIAMKLVERNPDLARVLIEGLGSCSVSKFDRKHLEREGSALEQLQKIIAEPPYVLPVAIEPLAVEAGAWFTVPFIDKDRVPKGVLYDHEIKVRFAATEALVAEMRRLGFEERTDLVDRAPPGRK